MEDTGIRIKIFRLFTISFFCLTSFRSGLTESMEAFIALAYHIFKLRGGSVVLLLIFRCCMVLPIIFVS